MKIFNKKKDEEKVEDEIISMANEGNEQGVIQDSELEMITNIFEFSEKQVKDIMTPRSNIIGIERNTPTKEIMDIMLENNYSRYPIYDEDIDNIQGILHFRDFVDVYLKENVDEWNQVMMKPEFVHPTQNISKLFKRMQKEKIHMAVVVDEYGQTEGIICMEDILEEIVGNIFDENDEEEQDIIKYRDGYVVDGMAELMDLEEILHIEFPDEDFQTVNGFMLYEFGRLPAEGELVSIIYKGYVFESISLENNMIGQVKITATDEREDDKDD